MLSAAEIVEIEAAIQSLQSAAAATDVGMIKTASETLSTATESFAAKRMDKSVASALTGQSLVSLASLGN